MSRTMLSQSRPAFSCTSRTVVILGTVLLLTLVNLATSVEFVDPDPNPIEKYERNHEKEFQDFCLQQQTIRETPEKIKKEECKRIHAYEFHEDDLKMIFVIFLVLLYGACVRSVLRFFHVSLPYTVVLMASGMLVGLGGKYFCYDMYIYTSIARLNPKVILFTFLPVLLFESSFSISGHVFIRAAGQVLLLAAPGMLFCTGLTACVCYYFFTSYKWSFLEAMFYGSIISATDPVAVVAILKELGVSETLSVLVDGESLLNDGVAILLYEVIGALVENFGETHHSNEELAWHIFLDFLKIALGGPLFGWLMAKIAIACLSRVFNDAVVEITITLVATYITYYVGEAVLGVSGVMAVVILGITMSAEKTCISPDVEHEVHEFWGMLGHLANTVLFFITGVIITERGTRGLNVDDFLYLILLYFSLNLIRFFMLLLMSPILSRIGYGMPWQNMIVMMWGGLRGAVGICLSLEVYENPIFCSKDLGPNILIQTAGIVFLTLTINGTTTKKLLEILKLTEVPTGRMEEMRNAVKHINLSQKKALIMLRHDRFLADANWTYVQENTKIDDPYKQKRQSQVEKETDTSLVSIALEQVTNECPECHSFVPNQPTNEELRVMTDEARLRVIKAMKISFWAHFERGVITEEAVQILSGTADTCADKSMYMIHSKDLKRYWEIRGIFPWIREKMVRQFGEDNKDSNAPPPEEKWKFYFWWLATKSWFDYLITSLVILNMIPAIWQLILESKYDQCELDWMSDYDFAFRVCNLIFTAVYAFEFVVKIIGLGVWSYWSCRWNWLDVTVLVVSITDVIISFLDLCGQGGKMALRSLFKIIKIVRCFRCLKLLRLMTPVIMDFVNGKINTQLFLGYDVALSFIVACDDVMKFLPQMIDNKKVLNKIRASIERERMETVRQMGMLQKDHPGIAIAIKTRHASRSVLNQMKSMLMELRQDGLLDEKENDLLTVVLEEKMKRLWNSPNHISPPAPEVLLKTLNWISGNPELMDFIFQNATLLQFEVGDLIASIGDAPQGIYVIISGMVKIHYEPHADVQALHEQWGAIPCMEIFKDFDFDKPTEDFLSSGTVIGELSLLTGRARTAAVLCETEGVQAFHIPLVALQSALSSFNDSYTSLEERLWRSCGMRMASSFLSEHLSYQSLPKEKLDALLERSCVPIGPQFQTIRVPSYVQDIVVIEGWVVDDQTADVYKAPAIIPKLCASFSMKENAGTQNRVLVILAEGQSPSEDDSDELSQCVLAAKKLRRPSLPSEIHADLAKLNMQNSEMNIGQARQRRPSLAVNFGVRPRDKKVSDQRSSGAGSGSRRESGGGV